MKFFNRFSHIAGRIVGSPSFFSISFIGVVAWLISGPIFHYSDTWQLLINTTTTIVTFLIAILIQHAQNRDTQITQLKLDELIKSVKKARNDMIDLENFSDTELKALEKKFKKVAQKRLEQSQK